MQSKFIDWNPTESTLKTVITCKAIVREYLEQDLRLTLRQLYYQFVARGLLPNTERSYKNLGNMVSKARLAGMLDWSAIEDRGRRPINPPEWNSLTDIIEVVLDQYRLPRWTGQECYAELWVEKEALAGVLEPIADEYHVTLMVNKGYSSSSAMFESAQRLIKKSQDTDDQVHIFYLGDHDPSGIDMIRDITDRLTLFTRDTLALQVEHLALTTEQVQEHQPPPNPTKVTDSRAREYITEYGHECWEVDALDPRTLYTIVSKAFDAIVDRDKMDVIIRDEEDDKKRLREAVQDIDLVKAGD